ncbi:hypothetical protein [Candidatus Poriferisodalis sp.]|uniref:hypothetical protein n=1 Tax=Candidatus Poriferisodalis sp. TaxID=3101277 RepID=UPI003B5C3367
MNERPPIFDETSMTAAQQRALDAIAAGPRGVVEGPLRVWLTKPGLAQTAQALGQHCRFDSNLGPYLSALAMVLVGVHWQADFEWHVHASAAWAAGPDRTVPSTIWS